MGYVLRRDRVRKLHARLSPPVTTQAHREPASISESRVGLPRLTKTDCESFAKATSPDALAQTVPAVYICEREMAFSRDKLPRG
jgi:hypothetical protein